jgi:hypothetical protein
VVNFPQQERPLRKKINAFFDAAISSEAKVILLFCSWKATKDKINTKSAKRPFKAQPLRFSHKPKHASTRKKYFITFTQL